MLSPCSRAAEATRHAQAAAGGVERRGHLRHVEGERLGAKVELDGREGVDADNGVQGQLQRLGNEGRSEVGAVEGKEDAARAHLVRARVGN